MPIVRTYRCPDCGAVYDHFHLNSDEPFKDCPACGVEPVIQPGGFRMTGAKAQAVDVMQNIAEKQFGLTNMQDNLREGDAAVKLTPDQSKMAGGFWGGGGLGPNLPAAALLAGAKAGPAAADPIAHMQNYAKANPKPFKTVDWK